VPRGPAGGATWLVGGDDLFMSRAAAFAQLRVAMGGRAAEMLLLSGEFTSGASSDIASATSLAHKMVTRLGMSDLGVAAISEEQASFGPLAEQVHAQVERMLSGALHHASEILSSHFNLVLRVAHELLAEETVTGQDLRRMAQDLQISVPVKANRSHQ
jgi:cell division protease FtsH